METLSDEYTRRSMPPAVPAQWWTITREILVPNRDERFVVVIVLVMSGENAMLLP